MIQLQLHRVSDSFGVAVPPEALAALGLTGREGERLALIPLAEGGLELRRNENDAERKHNLVLDTMRRYGDALRRLAT